MGGWYLANMMPGAHGSSEFVTCAAGPGAAAGASGGWVATGGTDWSVRELMFFMVLVSVFVIATIGCST